LQSRLMHPLYNFIGCKLVNITKVQCYWKKPLKIAPKYSKIF